MEGEFWENGIICRINRKGNTFSVIYGYGAEKRINNYSMSKIYYIMYNSIRCV